MKPTKKVPREINDGISETRKLEQLISLLCNKLDDPTFDLEQLQASLGEIRSTLDDKESSDKR
ncbi:MAG: hypothetical protein HY646_10590 [Acidobacteria bacterium]|nr:hypothetical protein [Acidobacteriota bacterium]